MMCEMLTITFFLYSLIFLNVTYSLETGIHKKVEGDLKVENILNVCLDSPRHKKEPGPEELKHECAPWKHNACCTSKTEKKIRKFSLYNFKYEMCPQKNMSEKCKQFFINDACFYECSPNIGPWKTVVNETDRKERFQNVPLCQSECDAWYSACAEDYACFDNWSEFYKLNPKDSNLCTTGNKNGTSRGCKQIRDMYPTANEFCQTVWDNSWLVVKDSQHCMRISLDMNQENPNDEVAELFANEKYGQRQISAIEGNSATLTTMRLPVLCTILYAALFLAS